MEGGLDSVLLSGGCANRLLRVAFFSVCLSHLFHPPRPSQKLSGTHSIGAGQSPHLKTRSLC